MKKILIISLALLNFNLAYMQTDIKNQQKYWKFRNSFRQDFIRIGKLPGESLPMGRRGFSKCVDNTSTYGGQKFGQLYWGDGVIRHGHYIGFLATEYRLLKNQGKDVITDLSAFDLIINIVPDNFDILAGQVKMNSIFGALLIQINQDPMPDWQHSTKRLFDVVASIFALIILLPVFIVIAILVKLTSKGSVFFKQERIGIKGKPFNIIKFRTMHVGAEKNGPQLSSSNDSRITSLGKFLRKTRLDEFPQFWNVLKGDMSIVGPRPERQFYIDQISNKDPQYLYLHKVRPGITSWGQVKYGYAENVDEMIQRMKYDLLYIRNMSLALDFKIMFYTIAIIVKAKGK